MGITGYVATTGEVCRDNTWVYVCGGYIYNIIFIRDFITFCSKIYKIVPSVVKQIVFKAERINRGYLLSSQYSCWKMKNSCFCVFPLVSIRGCILFEFNFSFRYTRIFSIRQWKFQCPILHCWKCLSKYFSYTALRPESLSNKNIFYVFVC